MGQLIGRMGQRLIHYSKLTHDIWKDSYVYSQGWYNQSFPCPNSKALEFANWISLLYRYKRNNFFLTDDKHWQFYLFI